MTTQLPNPTRTWTRTRPPRALAAALCALLLAFAPSARAQIRDVERYVAAVTSERAPFRAGETTRHYQIAELPAGTLLEIDGEGPEFVRAFYPPNLTAFVPADQVTFDQAANTLTLNANNRLRAANQPGGFAGSWASVLSSADALRAGTTLRVVEVMRADDGQVVGFRVPAPANARGFIGANLIRRANAEETARFRAARTPTPAPGTPAATPTGAQPVPQPTPTTGGAAPGTSPAAPAPTTPGATPTTPGTATTPATTPAPAATSTTPAGTPAAPATDLTEPVVRPGEEPAPVTIDQTVPPGAPGSGAPGSGAPGSGAPAPGVGTPNAEGADGTNPAGFTPVPERARAGTVEELEAAFTAVRRQPVLEAEIDQLLAEYERARDAALSDPATGGRRAAALQQRIEVLRLQQDYRNRVRDLEERRRALDASVAAANSAIAEVERTRVYTIVGQLQASALYDGRNMPLMFRVQSVGGRSPRTLGYIKPDPRLNLESKVGLVVGIIGQSTVDEALRLNVITPVRVDPLRPTAQLTPEAAARAAQQSPEGATGAPAANPAAPMSPAPSRPAPTPARPSNDGEPQLPPIIDPSAK